MSKVIQVLAATIAKRQACVLATVIETWGSVSAQLGSKAVIDASGKVIAGWIGGGCAQSTVCNVALNALKNGEPMTIKLDLNDEVLGTGMPCGGNMQVFVDPLLPSPRLWILGKGRITEALCDIAASIGLEVFVFTDLQDEGRFKRATAIITDDPMYRTLTPHQSDYAVVATQHKGDHLSMKRLLASEISYVGLIASRKRTRLVIDFLRDEGFSEPDLSRIYAPAGLDLGKGTPEEVALSILSEITMVRRGGGGRPMRAIGGNDRARRPRKEAVSTS